MNNRAAGWVVVACTATLAGCTTTPEPPGGGNGGGNGGGTTACDAPAEGEAVICLGSNGLLRAENGAVASTQVIQDLREQFPAETPTTIRVAIDADDVTVTDFDGAALTEDGTAIVLLFWSAEDAPDSCAAAASFNQFLITVEAGEVVSVTPARSALGAAVADLVSDGTFGVCVTLTSSIEGDFSIESMNLQFAG